MVGACCLQIAASDAMIGKIGYGTVSECLAHGKPLVFVRRDYFNEEPFLRRLLQIHNAAVEIRRRDFMDGNWAPFLTAAAELTITFRSVLPQASGEMSFHHTGRLWSKGCVGRHINY